MPTPQKEKFQFPNIAAFTRFLLQSQLEQTAVTALQLLRKSPPPSLSITDRPDAELLKSLKEGLHRFLMHLSSGNKDMKNEFPTPVSCFIILPRPHTFGSKDIAACSYIRSKLFRTYIDTYTSDQHTKADLDQEILEFTSVLDEQYISQLLESKKVVLDQTQSLSKIGNWVLDLESNAMTWSDELFKIYGISPQKDLKRPDARALTLPEDRELVDQKMQELLTTLETTTFYYRIRTAAGDLKYLHARAQVEVDENNRPVRLFGTLQDTTEVMIAHEEVRKSEERYHAMISELGDYAIIFLNRDGTIGNWNKGAEKIKGYSAEEVIGKHFRLFYPQSDLDNNLPEELLKIALVTGKVTHEGWRLRKDGSQFWGNVVITTLYDKNQKVFGFTKVTRDLTEKKLAEDKLRELAEHLQVNNKKLEQANKELESFSYIASHDLQEPLRKIQAFSNRLLQKEHDALSDWGKDVFAKIQNAAERMQKLIDALLNFSRLESTPEAVRPINLDLVIEDILSTLQTSIEEKNAKIEVGPLPTINAVGFHISQLFTNLVSNAIKYSKAGVAPVVKISAEIVSGQNLQSFPAVSGMDYHHIQVADNGIGFDPQYSQKIFELFQRLHGKTEYEGTGIGLAICKKIVENHYGFISGEGFPGSGSVFHVYLPISKVSK
jgi:PAS domain S-box-containing protein